MTSKFEWDDDKAASNYVKHDVSFDAAIEVFSDPRYIERMDEDMDYGEERYLVTGLVDGSLLTVVYTERGDTMRIISARDATKREHDNYYRQTR